MLKHKESDILKACQDLLEAHGILYVRHNPLSPVRPCPWRKVRASQKGSPDIIVFHAEPGTSLRVVAVECKSPEGKLSPAQENWKRRAEIRGLQYVVVREISDLIKVLEL